MRHLFLPSWGTTKPKQIEHFVFWVLLDNRTYLTQRLLVQVHFPWLQPVQTLRISDFQVAQCEVNADARVEVPSLLQILQEIGPLFNLQLVESEFADLARSIIH